MLGAGVGLSKQTEKGCWTSVQISLDSIAQQQDLGEIKHRLKSAGVCGNLQKCMKNSRGGEMILGDVR